MTMNEALREYWALVCFVVRQRIDSNLARQAFDLRPCDVDELVDEATCQVFKHMPKHVDEDAARSACITAAIFAARNTMRGSRLCPSGNTIQSTATMFVDCTDPDAVETPPSYHGPDLNELMSVFDNREQTIAWGLLNGSTHNSIGEQFGVSGRTIRNRIAKMRKSVSAIL